MATTPDRGELLTELANRHSADTASRLRDYLARRGAYNDAARRGRDEYIKPVPFTAPQQGRPVADKAKAKLRADKWVQTHMRSSQPSRSTRSVAGNSQSAPTTRQPAPSTYQGPSSYATSRGYAGTPVTSGYNADVSRQDYLSRQPSYDPMSSAYQPPITQSFYNAPMPAPASMDSSLMAGGNLPTYQSPMGNEDLPIWLQVLMNPWVRNW